MDDQIHKLNERFDLDRFFERLAGSPRPVLMLDYDGTLAPFQVDRHRAYPYPGVRSRLQVLLQETCTRLVMVSGRPVNELLGLLQMDVVPEIWGCHGAERRRPDGTHDDYQPPPRVAKFLERVTSWAASKDEPQRYERKPSGIAVHWRGLPEAAQRRMHQEMRSIWEKELPAEVDLTEYDGGLELRLRDVTKRTAVKTVLAEEADSAVAAYLGDDLTDEDAFGGLGGDHLKVLVRSELRDTAADLWLEPPEGLLTFLDRWIETTGGD